MYAKRELDFFRGKCPVNEEVTNIVSRLVLLKLIPSAIERNISMFGEAITQMGGIGFKKYEVERLCNELPRVHDLLEFISKNSRSIREASRKSCENSKSETIALCFLASERF